MARLKRIIPLLLALALVVPVLLIAAPVTAKAADSSTHVVDYTCSDVSMYVYRSPSTDRMTTYGESYSGASSFVGDSESYYRVIYGNLGDTYSGVLVAVTEEMKTDEFSIGGGFTLTKGGSFDLQFSFSVDCRFRIYVHCFDSSYNSLGYVCHTASVNTSYSDSCVIAADPILGSELFPLTAYMTVYVAFGVLRDWESASSWPGSYNNDSFAYLFTAASWVFEPYFELSFVGSATTPTLETSLNATQRIPYGESINLFVLADNVNGDVTIDWYVNGALSESFDMYSVGSGNQAIGAWKFTPGSSGAYFVYAVVTNTVGDSSVSVTSITGHLIFYDSSGDDDSGGSGDDSGSTSCTDPTTDTSGDDDTELGTSAKLEEIETSLDEVKDAVASVEDKLDGVSDQLDGVSDQLDGVSDQLEESNSWLSNIADGITSLPEKIMDGIKGLFVPDEEAIAEQQYKWNQLLADRFGVVYESVEIVDNLAGAFTNDGTTDLIEFPTVTVPLGEIDWTFGGWEVDVVPDGFEFLIEVLKKIIDILCTLAFVNAMKNKYERVLDDRGG